MGFFAKLYGESFARGCMGAQILKMAAANDTNDPNPDAIKVTFEDFWARYPRRVAKKDALMAWRKIDPRDYEKIIAAVEAHRRSEQWKKSGGVFIPYPASWLNGERWNDELDSDITMGQCVWNRNGNRGPGGQCTEKAVTERNGGAYCKRHGEQV